MDRLPILSLPNDERVVLPDASQEFVVWGELQFQNLVLNAAKNRHWLARLHVPQNNGSVGLLLEDCAFLARRDDVSRVGDSDGGNLHVVAPQELLIVLVREVFDHKKSSNVVQQSVLHRGVELHSVRVLSIVSNRVVHLDHSLLTFDGLRLVHGSHVSWGLVSLIVAENARLEVLLLSLLHF